MLDNSCFAASCRAKGVKLRVTLLCSSAGLHPGVCRTEPGRGRVHGMVLRSKSAPQDKTVPFVNIPLADGQVCYQIFFNFSLKVIDKL